MIRVANAPVSFGVFELTVGRIEGLPGPEEVLGAVRDAGYDGIDLGPAGFLGRGAALRERLESRGLQLAGGWVAFRLTDPAALEEDLEALDEVLDAFVEANGEAEAAFQPKPTIADAGDPQGASSARPSNRPELPPDRDGWDHLARSVRAAAERCRERGFEPTFHHHAGTRVQTPAEIERLLEATDVGLCLDTGHLLLGGGDPVAALRDWGHRVNHVHLKDARRGVLDRIAEEGGAVEDVWRRGAFCELGTGDLDIDGVLRGLFELEYRGWLVVEQDRIPGPGEPVAEAAAAQARNRRFLEERRI